MHVLRIWKELFRRPRLDESIAEVATILAAELGLGGIVVRQLDLKTRAFTTTATSRAGAWNTFPPGQNKCKPEQIELLLGWFGSKEIVRGRPRSHPLVRALVGDALRADVTAGPLLGDTEEAPVTVLLLLGPEGSMGRRHTTTGGSARQLVRMVSVDMPS